MKIESLRLQNFRCFEDIQIKFDPQLTVLVGVNGSGKTAVLDAIAVFTKAFMEKQPMPAHNYPNIALKKTDLCSWCSSENIQLTCKQVDGEELLLAFGQAKHNPDQLDIVDEENTRRWHGTLDTLLSNSDTHGVIIFTFYGAQRCLPENYKQAHVDDNARDNVFQDAFSANINFKASSEWFIKKSADQALQRDKLKDFSYKIAEVEAITHAVTGALNNGYDDIEVEAATSQFRLRKKNTQDYYEISQLSDGYKTMLALVMDLARRMAVANGELYRKKEKPPLASPAIVLIDEVELHLHPSWQQTVLPTLMDIFPNTQFIVTTHSPQIISSIEPKHIRLLTDGKVLPVETSTYGAESSRILDEVFHVSIRPNNEVKDALDTYLKLINDGQGNTENAKALRAKLDNWLAEDPVLNKADMFIVRNARRREREDNSRA